MRTIPLTSFILCLFSIVMPLQSQVTTPESIPDEGVLLLPPTSAEFAAALDPDRDLRLDSLLPYAVLLKNNSDQEIIAYSVRWICTDSRGLVTTREVTTFDFATFHSPSNLPARTGRIISNIHFLGDRRLTWDRVAEEAEDSVLSFRRQVSITPSLEAVLFADGTAVGRDRNNWIPRWRAYIDAERDIFGELVSGRKDSTERLSAAVQEASTYLQQRSKSTVAGQTRDFGLLQLEAHRAQTYEECYLLLRGFFAGSLLRDMEQEGEANAYKAVTRYLNAKVYPKVRRNGGASR
jgi:hypothetical protein